jgi:hypothetical protein
MHYCYVMSHCYYHLHQITQHIIQQIGEPSPGIHSCLSLSATCKEIITQTLYSYNYSGRFISPPSPLYLFICSWLSC